MYLPGLLRSSRGHRLTTTDCQFGLVPSTSCNLGSRCTTKLPSKPRYCLWEWPWRDGDIPILYDRKRINLGGVFRGVHHACHEARRTGDYSGLPGVSIRGLGVSGREVVMICSRVAALVAAGN